MTRRKYADGPAPRYVALYHWLMRTEAWRDLDPVSRCVYVELSSRYAGPGSNNGRIPFSLLELANALHVSKQTAMRALDKLVDHGFIVLTKIGAFSVKDRQASEWRLTEFKDDVTGNLPSKEFAAWRKSKNGSTTKPARVSIRNGTGFEVEQVSSSNLSYGSKTTPAHPRDGSTTKPLLVYQGEAPSADAEAAQGGGAARPAKARVSATAQAMGSFPVAPTSVDPLPVTLGLVTSKVVEDIRTDLKRRRRA